jgi:hypothetical protein
MTDFLFSLGGKLRISAAAGARKACTGPRLPTCPLEAGNGRGKYLSRFLCERTGLRLIDARFSKSTGSLRSTRDMTDGAIVAVE